MGLAWLKFAVFDYEIYKDKPTNMKIRSSNPAAGDTYYADV